MSLSCSALICWSLTLSPYCGCSINCNNSKFVDCTLSIVFTFFLNKLVDKGRFSASTFWLEIGNSSIGWINS